MTVNTVTHFAPGGGQSLFTVPGAETVNAVRVNTVSAPFTQPLPWQVNITTPPALNDRVDIDYGFVSASITAANTFTRSYSVEKGEKVLLVVGGSGWVATARLQISTDNGATWSNVQSWTAPAALLYESPAQCLIRLGCVTGEYTSGTIPMRIDS